MWNWSLNKNSTLNLCVPLRLKVLTGGICLHEKPEKGSRKAYRVCIVIKQKLQGTLYHLHLPLRFGRSRKDFW